MSAAENHTLLYARCVLADHPGSSIGPHSVVAATLPEGYTLVTAESWSTEVYLAPPYQTIPVLPGHSAYAGEIIGIVVGPEWSVLDALVPQIPQHRDLSISTENRLIGTVQWESREHEADQESDHLVEGSYHTELQLHGMDVPLWAEARPGSGTPAGATAKREAAAQGWTVRLPTQWPAIVRESVALTTTLPSKQIDLRVIPVQAPRDGALHLPAHLAVLAVIAATTVGTSVRIALRGRESFLSGGRSPARIRMHSRVSDTGRLLVNTCEIELDGGAYPTLQEETAARMKDATLSLYSPVSVSATLRTMRSSAPPMGAFEGAGTAQITFAREVHFNRLASLFDEDPVAWRLRNLRQDWPILSEIAQRLADESDFNRRYAANELVRKRRLQLPQNSSVLKGIGCAIAEQASGFIAGEDRGAVTVRLDADGTARLFCSVPTPNPRLRQSWRQVVAQSLQMELDEVLLETSLRNEQGESGPRLFSRGIAQIPRAIQSCCDAIQKQRFREPLPIQVRRAVRGSRATRSPAEALRSVGAAAVETTIAPATMTVQVRTVTLIVYAGRILDRSAAEAEIRRGIYQSLSWALHEGFPTPSRLNERPLRRRYAPFAEDLAPRVRVVFMNAARKDGPTGLGEIPFLTVPAALTSALSQATGLFLDSSPTRMSDTLRMLRDDL